MVSISHLIFCGKGQLWYIEETKAPDVSNLGYPKWVAENLIVQAWLINSMDVEIGRTYLFLPTAKEL